MTSCHDKDAVTVTVTLFVTTFFCHDKLVSNLFSMTSEPCMTVARASEPPETLFMYSVVRDRQVSGKLSLISLPHVAAHTYTY